MSVADNTLIDEAEWQAQERALREATGRHIDRRDASYRLIANAVQSAPGAALPVDFAADVIRRVDSHEAGFERLLSRMLMALFLTALAIFGAVYGGQLWRAVSYGYGGGVSGWILIVASCIGLSWVVSWLIEPRARLERQMHVIWHQ